MSCYPDHPPPQSRRQIANKLGAVCPRFDFSGTTPKCEWEDFLLIELRWLREEEAYRNQRVNGRLSKLSDGVSLGAFL